MSGYKNPDRLSGLRGGDRYTLVSAGGRLTLIGPPGGPLSAGDPPGAPNPLPCVSAHYPFKTNRFGPGPAKRFLGSSS